MFKLNQYFVDTGIGKIIPYFLVNYLNTDNTRQILFYFGIPRSTSTLLGKLSTPVWG